MNSVALLALAAGSFGYSSACIIEVLGVTASANGWDTRTSGNGCAPNGCVPANVLDNSIDSASRWSCSAKSAGVDACELTLDFDGPQDFVYMDMALYKGDERTRSVNVWVDGVLEGTLSSSGTTEHYETYLLSAEGASSVVLQAAGVDDDEWLSITEVIFYVDDGLTCPPAPTTTTLDDDASTSEITGVTASANGWDTRTSGNGCAPNGCVPANVLDNSIDSASRWSCSAASADVDACELTLEFKRPQDLVQMYMALYKGDERTRSINVWVDGSFLQTITSNGTIAGYEPYPLIAPGASTVVLQATDIDDSEWLSILEVEFIAGDAPPTPSPASVAPPTPSPMAVDDDSSTLIPTLTTSTTELPPTLEFIGVPDVVLDAILEDAPYGLANGIIFLDEYGIVLDEDDSGVAQISGTVRLFESQTALADSITFYYYAYSDSHEPVTTYVRGEGQVDSSTGIFSASVSVPEGKSKVALAFVVLDEADRTTNLYPDTVAIVDVLDDCGEPYMTITLEAWDNVDARLYMTVNEPSEGPATSRFQNYGVISLLPPSGYGSQTYQLYNGLDIDSDNVLSDYDVTIWRDSIQTEIDTNWQAIVTVDGEVVQEFTGVFSLGGSGISSFTYTLDSYSIADC